MADTEVPQLHKRRRRCLVAQICPFRRLGRKMRGAGTYDVGAVQVVPGGPGMWSPFERADPEDHEPLPLPTLGVSVSAMSSSGGGSNIVAAEPQQQQEVADSPAVPVANNDPDPEELVDPETGEVAQ